MTNKEYKISSQLSQDKNIVIYKKIDSKSVFVKVAY